MANDENVVITKNLSFGELLRFFASTLGMKQRMEQTIHVPDAIYERIIETNSLHVIHSVVDDLIAVLDGVVGVEPTEPVLLTNILAMDKLDEIRAVCCDRLGRIEEAKVLRDFMAKRAPPNLKPQTLGDWFTFADPGQAFVGTEMRLEQLTRRPMTQADLSRIHQKDYVDDGWRRESGVDGPTGFMVRDSILEVQLPDRTGENKNKSTRNTIGFFAEPGTSLGVMVVMVIAYHKELIGTGLAQPYLFPTPFYEAIMNSKDPDEIRQACLDLLEGMAVVGVVHPDESRALAKLMVQDRLAEMHAIAANRKSICEIKVGNLVRELMALARPWRSQLPTKTTPSEGDE